MNEAVLRELKAARDDGQRILFVHYACANFRDFADQPTPVACIAVAELGSQGQVKTFSMIDQPDGKDEKEREKDLLQRYYDEMRAYPDARVVHWNMNSASYGFTAIAARYRHLFDKDAPNYPASDRKFDLDDIIKDKFGDRYVDHPKFRKLCDLNGLYMSHFLAGADEAAAIANGLYGTVVSSTSEKVHLISQIFTRLCTGKLKTLNSVGWVDFADQQIDAVKVAIELAERLRSVYIELSRRHSQRSTITLQDEYDAQDLYRSLLRIFFGNIQAEAYTSPVAGAATRIDFMLPDVGLAVELKYTRPSMSAKSLGEELIIDRSRYSAHPNIRHLLFIVFDPGNEIVNPRGIEADLMREKSEDDFAVTVRILERRV